MASTGNRIPRSEVSQWSLHCTGACGASQVSSLLVSGRKKRCCSCKTIPNPSLLSVAAAQGWCEVAGSWSSSFPWNNELSHAHMVRDVRAGRAWQGFLETGGVWESLRELIVIQSSGRTCWSPQHSLDTAQSSGPAQFMEPSCWGGVGAFQHFPPCQRCWNMELREAGALTWCHKWYHQCERSSWVQLVCPGGSQPQGPGGPGAVPVG